MCFTTFVGSVAAGLNEPGWVIEAGACVVPCDGVAA